MNDINARLTRLEQSQGAGGASPSSALDQAGSGGGCKGGCCGGKCSGGGCPHCGGGVGAAGHASQAANALGGGIRLQ